MGGGRYILYGCGHAAEYYVKYLEKHCELVAIIDKTKAGQKQFGVDVYTLEEISSNLNLADYNIVIGAPSIKEELYNNIKDYVSKDNIWVFDSELSVYYGVEYKSYKEFLNSNKDILWEVYRFLKDEKSKQCMLAVMEGRLTGDLNSVSDVWEEDQYWPKDIIKFKNDEIIIECGTSDGKNLLQLIEMTKGGYEKIYCFEPDPLCVPILEDISKKYKNITYVKKGTYKEITTLRFSSDTVESGLSKCDSEGDAIIEVVSLDDYIQGRVSFIKMDIEGSELDTLKGAERIIREYKPTLAVCVYHKNEDIIDIPLYLKKINPKYSLYLRHHNCNMTETVLYAVDDSL